MLDAPPPPPPTAPALPRMEITVPRRIGGADVRGTLRMPGYRGRIAIDVRGGWSRRFPKRSYNLELQDADGSNRNAPLLGMPADDDWVLYAGYNDRTLMRNVLAYATARSMGRYAARTRYVQLRIGGRYRGVYVLMEKLKVLDRRVPAGDGFLLELTSRNQARRKDPSFRTPVTRVPVVWADPERGDLSRRRARGISRRVVRIERALYRGGAGAWRRHLHGPAAVDYALLNELFKNQDAMLASTYMWARPGGRLELGPVWDFDHSMGNSGWGPSAVLRGWMLDRRPWMERLYRDAAFRRAMHRRWRELRRAGLRARLGRRIARLDRALAPAARRDSARWPADGVHRARGTRSVHVENLRKWLRRRITWLDRKLREEA